MKWFAVYLSLTFWLHFDDASLCQAADLEMVDAFGHVTGVIDVSAAGLSVFENSGDRFFYQRAPRYDLPSGRYLGFYSSNLNRVIRFPRSGRGPIERADLDARIPRFVPATVSVRPIGSGPGFGPYLSGWANHTSLPPAVLGGHYGPAVNNGYSGYPAYSWYPRYPGYSSTFSIGVASIGVPHSSGMVPPTGLQLGGYQPSSVLLESRVVENASLPPVEVELVNSHNEQLVVTLTDTRNPNKRPRYTLDPGQRKRVKLPRDNGETRIDLYQTTDATGMPIEQELKVNVAPRVRFQVTVHRMRIQSIAIDRTGKSPNPIEDVNRQGVGVGRFDLPAGDRLNSGTIDVYSAAVAAANPGTVPPLGLSQ